MPDSKPNIKSSTSTRIADNSRDALRHVLWGNVVTSDFFWRHKLKIFVALVLIMIYISTKYQCLTSMESIRRLEQELEVVRTERIRAKSDYMSRIRESSMAALADSIHPGLKARTAPPVLIDYLDK